jgi:5-methyltetrahydropteroyltriglutamate--homocysteine methyltransferase
MKVIASNIGYPSVGEKRELKFLIESFWKGEKSKDEFESGINSVLSENLRRQSSLDSVPLGEFTLYDRMLDLTVLFNLIPKRFENTGDETKLYFDMARGKGAMEMTKWFNTNYHYLVPELSDGMTPRVNTTNNKYINMLRAHKQGHSRITLIGPYTFVKLSKGYKDFSQWFNALSELYVDLIKSLCKEGVKYVHIEEPALVLDIPKSDMKYVQAFFSKIKDCGAKIMVTTYFDSITHYKDVVALPVDAVGMDFVSNTGNLVNIKKFGFPKDKVLCAGIINGRNIWITNLKDQIDLCKILISKLKPEELIISPSCSLQHVPVTAKYETSLSKVLRDNIAFADEKLKELLIIKKALTDGIDSVKAELAANAKALKEKKTSGECNLKDVKLRLKRLKVSDFKRKTAFALRKKIQQNALNLPLLPTTTIGSFPQTDEVRHMRTEFRKGQISSADYKKFINEKIVELVKLQESIGLDVLVHGEFERTDMVEFFGEKLSGFTTSLNGWVASYGTRCVKPPIIWADVKRMRPMTVEEIGFAQSQTEKLMKGMLTGPMTIINWSFVREDIPKKDIAYQIGLALNDEVLDLEKNGIKVIQIDEPALQEGNPLKHADRKRYYDFGVKAFRLVSARVKEKTQIHTHMCYSNFNEIIGYIDAMDADVISIENSRSKGELLEVFKKYKYKKGIGPGVYDIHSPAIPSKEEILSLINKSLENLKPDQLWVNPDCGLKTRGYKETIPALKNMVEAAKIARSRLNGRPSKFSGKSLYGETNYQAL